jgi:addiction module HigA family antidote
MHNSAHPVEVLREWLSDGMTVTEAAKELQVSRVTFSKVLNGKADVTSGVGLRLSVWLSTSPDVWFGLVWFANTMGSCDYWANKSNISSAQVAEVCKQIYIRHLLYFFRI